MEVRHTLVKKFGFGNFFTNPVTVLVSRTYYLSAKYSFKLMFQKNMPNRHFAKLQLFIVLTVELSFWRRRQHRDFSTISFVPYRRLLASARCPVWNQPFLVPTG